MRYYVFSIVAIILLCAVLFLPTFRRNRAHHGQDMLNLKITQTHCSTAPVERF